MRLLKNKKWLWLLLVLALWPVSARPAEFAGQTLTRVRGVTVTGRILVKDKKLRQEFNDEKGRTITILRLDKKVVWVLLPRERTYMEEPLKSTWPGQFIQIPPEAKKKRLLGSERVLGYDAQKYQVSVPGKRGPEIQIFWVAPKLGLPIKEEIPSRKFSMEYRDITERSIADRLFEIPKGYKKVSKPVL